MLPEIKKWVEKENLKIEFKTTEHDGFYRLKGVGADWKPKNYVRMFTEMSQRGLTKCIVGTRGLLGEGWDASKINVLIDLTMVTSSMSINQLRGRSFRLDKDDPKKVANNWDVICLLPESRLGRSDFKRFQRKHANLYGVCDDKAIEKGPGHVHPGLSKKNAYDIIADSMARFGHGSDRARTQFANLTQSAPVPTVGIKKIRRSDIRETHFSRKHPMKGSAPSQWLP